MANQRNLRRTTEVSYDAQSPDDAGTVPSISPIPPLLQGAHTATPQEITLADPQSNRVLDSANRTLKRRGPKQASPMRSRNDEGLSSKENPLSRAPEDLPVSTGPYQAQIFSADRRGARDGGAADTIGTLSSSKPLSASIKVRPQQSLSMGHDGNLQSTLKGASPGGGTGTPLGGICGNALSQERGCSESSSCIDMNALADAGVTGILDPNMPIFRFNNVPTVSTARVKKIVEARQRPNFRMTNDLPQASLTIQSIKPRRPQDRALVTREGLTENIARLSQVITP